MIKPDGIQRGFIGNIISRFETKGYKLIALKIQKPTSKILNQHYLEHINKDFFPKLKNYLLSGPVVCMVWEGTDVIQTSRRMLGETNPLKSLPGTIRGDLGITMGRNLCHGSDSMESAEREIKIWFKEEELINWNSHSQDWIYE